MIASTPARNIAVLGPTGSVGASALDADRKTRARTRRLLALDLMQTLPT